jgi:hypothetical protein
MGFAFLDKYDVDACAQLCNARGADPNGGGCAYFNIWRAVVSGVPTTYTCSMVRFVPLSRPILTVTPPRSTISLLTKPPPSTSARVTSL